MKKHTFLSFKTLIALLILNFNLQATVPVNLEVAKRVALYYGESVFEKDLKICDHELMYWPWGEEAVYVFTLMEEGDYSPKPVYLDYPFLQGAYLAASGQKVEGYRMMAQAERYMTGRYTTLKEWFLPGAKLIYQGLDIKANISAFWRKNSNRNTFFNKFAAEIDANYPVEIGG